MIGRNGLGQIEALQAVVGDIADRIVKAVLPKVTQLAQAASAAAEPTIRKIVREEVIPKAALYGIGGIVGVGALAALIGSLMARRNGAAR